MAVECQINAYTAECEGTYHSEVMQTIAPRHLQDYIGTDQVVASVEHANVALAAANIDKLYYKLA
jgi:hypothetical protein